MYYLLIFIVITSMAQPTLAQNCGSDEYLVPAHSRKAYIRRDGTVVSAANVSTHCKKRSSGYAYVFKNLKKGRPLGWPHKAEKEKNWTESEKNQLIEAIEELPKELLVNEMKGIYRMSSSRDFPNPASNGGEMIVLYDSAFDGHRDLSRILAHEFIHLGYEKLSKDEQQDYRRAVGWTLELASDSKIYYVGRKEGYVADDGRGSPEEDFANNFEYFIFEPDKLKKITNTAYQWFEKRYRNIKRPKGKK